MYGLTFPVLKDNISLYSMFGDGYIPYNVVLDKDMVVRYSDSGFAENLIKLQIQNWLAQIPTGVDGHEDNIRLPAEHRIVEVYPNPFNLDARVKLRLTQPGRVTLRIFNLKGKMVEQLLNDVFMSPGVHELSLNGKSLSSGLYMIKLEVNGKSYTEKFILLK